MATDILTAFKSLSLAEQTAAYQQITISFEAAKDARRQQLEAEIRGRGFVPGTGKKPALAAVKFRSKSDPTKGWAGRGAEPTWLKQEMKASGLPLDAFKVS